MFLRGHLAAIVLFFSHCSHKCPFYFFACTCRLKYYPIMVWSTTVQSAQCVSWQPAWCKNTSLSRRLKKSQVRDCPSSYLPSCLVILNISLCLAFIASYYPCDSVHTPKRSVMGLQSLGSGGYSSWCFDEYPLSPWRGSMVIGTPHMLRMLSCTRTISVCPVSVFFYVVSPLLGYSTHCFAGVCVSIVSDLCLCVPCFCFVNVSSISHR